MIGEPFRVVPAAYVVLQRGPEALQLRRGTGCRDGHRAVAAAGNVDAGQSGVRSGLPGSGQPSVP